MHESYRNTEAAGHDAAANALRPLTAPGRALRTVLVVLLVVSVVGNAVASAMTTSVVLHVVCGVTTLSCVTGLVLQYLRRRG